jgi:hypothetical protein
MVERALELEDELMAESPSCGVSRRKRVPQALSPHGSVPS